MPTRDSAPLGAPCWVDVFTSDVEGAKEFYGGLFGWTAQEADPRFGGYFNFLEDGQPVAGCMVNGGTDPNAVDMWSVYLAVADAEATQAAAVEHGAQVYVPAMAVDTLGTMLVVGDPTGAAIGAWQPGEHPGFVELGEPDVPCWFEILTRDYQAALGFYRDVFGWDVHTMSDTPEFRYSTFGEGTGALAGIMDAAGFLPEGVPSYWSIYFGTADTDRSCATAVDLGGTVVEPPQDSPYGRMATVADRTGTRFKLVST